MEMHANGLQLIGVHGQSLVHGLPRLVHDVSNGAGATPTLRLPTEPPINLRHACPRQFNRGTHLMVAEHIARADDHDCISPAGAHQFAESNSSALDSDQAVSFRPLNYTGPTPHCGQFNLSEEQRAVVKSRDVLRMIEAGGNVYYPAKLAGIFAHNVQDIGAQQPERAWMNSRQGLLPQGGVASTHVPAIGKAIAEKKQTDPYWKPFFQGFDYVHRWLAREKPDVARRWMFYSSGFGWHDNGGANLTTAPHVRHENTSKCGWLSCDLLPTMAIRQTGQC